jgi:two-component system sensor histidine kinase/response regulator
MLPREQSHLSPLLIVDDNEGTREVIRILFEDAGYTTIEATNGQEALVVLRESSEPLVVLLDIRMPEVSGEEVLRTILRDRRLRRRHTFILVSGVPHLSRSLRLQRMLRALAVEVVTKPFNVAALEQAIARAQQRQRGLSPFKLPVLRWSR